MRFDSVQSLIEYIEKIPKFQANASLKEMNVYLDILNHPEKDMKYIHVAGTNGKGSTIAFLENILCDMNYNVGSFTSPYIISFNERIRFNKEFISDYDLLEIGNRILSIYPVIESKSLRYPSFFEFITLVCFIYFKEYVHPDFVLLECGIGGRYDSTNVIEPLVSIITSVSYDHMNVLGNTLNEILYQKVGIVKNSEAFVYLDNPQLEQKCVDYIKDDNPNYFTKRCHFISSADFSTINSNLCETNFMYKDDLYRITMLGYHQITNAILAINVINYLKDNNYINVDNFNRILKNSLSETFWQGRLERVNDYPIVLLDGAHNVDALLKVCNFLKNQCNKVLLKGIVAFSSDKDIDNNLSIIDSTFDSLIFTSYNNSRSIDPDLLFDKSKCKDKKVIHDFNDIKKEINSDFINVFIGSLYFVSEIRKYFKEK